MFIRKKQNKSGSVSVQIIQKISKTKIKIVKHIGTGKNENEIQQLLKQAREELHNEQLNIFNFFSKSFTS